MDEYPIRKHADNGAPGRPHTKGLGRLSTASRHLKLSLIFLTRIPVNGDGLSTPFNFGRASGLFPVVGALVGFVAGVIFVTAVVIGTPIWVASCLAIGATIALTGGLHEDGLADTLDGFGGGQSLERKLEIMRDSRIGTHGAIALILSIVIRIATIASVAQVSIWAAAAALVAAEAVSRAAMVRVWHDLPAARDDGLAHDLGPPDSRAMVTALIIGTSVAILMVWIFLGLIPALIGILLAAITTYIAEKWISAQIGGRTGDTLGAVQQIAALALLIGVASAV